MTSLTKSLLGVVCVVGLTVACTGQKQAAPETTAAAQATADPAGVTTLSGDGFGVAECDSYMKKYIACVDAKVPEAARSALKQAVDQQKAAWQQAAATPAGKAALASACVQAETAAKQAMTAYGCQW